MKFYPFVYTNSDEKIEIKISKATQEDYLVTNRNPKWQSSWVKAAKEVGSKYAFKTLDGELIALGRYVNSDGAMYIHIAYIEAQALSNPTIVAESKKKYKEIGRLLIAFGIKLSIDCGYGGDVAFEAKTDELAEYYIKKFHAMELRRIQGEPRRFMLGGDEAWNVFKYYLQ